MKIVAIVVTFNRSQKLEKSIRSIYRGDLIPDEVVVVNNCSKDDTDLVLRNLEKEFQSLIVVETKKNIGGAGGFTVGLKTAYERQASHFWIMDDDTYSLDDTLSTLISAFGELNKLQNIGFLCSRVKWVDDENCLMNQPETSLDWIRNYSDATPMVRVASCSFVSCLFTRDVLEKVGLPILEFFIWFDDYEFTHRVSNIYPCYAVLNSCVIHDTPTNQGVSFKDIDNDNLWKYSYGAMNESWCKFRRKSFSHWLYFWAQKNQEMHKGHVSVKNRAVINFQILKGPFRKLSPKNVQDFPIEDHVRSRASE